VPFYGVQGAMMTKWTNPDKHNVKFQTNAVLADLTTKPTQLLLANATIRTPANLDARKAFKDVDSKAFFTAGQGAVVMPQILEMGTVWSPVANAWSQVKQNKSALKRFEAAQKTVYDSIHK